MSISVKNVFKTRSFFYSLIYLDHNLAFSYHSSRTDWSERDDIKAEMKVDLIILLAKHDYPPVDRDEVYKEIFEQAENFKRHN